MRASTTAWLAAAGLLAAGQVLAQLPGDAARPTDARPAQRDLPVPFVTRQTDLEIPFSVKAGATPASQPAAVRVFVSWDRGISWHLYEEKKPLDGRFRFRPKQDGEYWFATQTVDRSGKSDSPPPRQPQLRLVIDTQKPQLVVQTTVVRGGDLTVAWTAADATLNPTTLKVEYQDATGGGGSWQTVTLPAADGNASAGQTAGTAKFTPQVSSSAINLRAEVTDGAGNTAYYSQRLSLDPPLAVRPGGLAATPAPDPSATRWTGDAPPTSTPIGDQESMIAESDLPRTQPKEIANNPAGPEGTVENPYARQDRFAAASKPSTSEYLPPAPSQADESLSPAAEDLPPPEPTYGNPPVESSSPPAEQGSPSPSYSPPTIPSYSSESLPVESPPTYDPAEPTPDPAPAPQPEPITPTPNPSYSPSYSPGSAPQVEPIEAPQGNRPRLTNTRRFSLDYDVEAVGPEGLADVELWGTSDGGRTWSKWGADPDRKSPFDVEVAGEGIFGFRVVIVGKNGLAASAPQNGDAADIWVGIDLTRPKARLTGAAYGKGDAAGKLDIRWQADDANLAQRPVTLAIGERPDGPFTPVAAGLPNNGQYLWEFDPRSPRQIYLRLEVRDDAGNISVDQLTEPIQVEGLQPKGRIRGFAPATETPRGAFRPPLFR